MGDPDFAVVLQGEFEAVSEAALEADVPVDSGVFDGLGGFDEAVEYIQRWKPSTNTVMLIQQTNGQTSLFDRTCAPAGKLIDTRDAAIRG